MREWHHKMAGYVAKNDHTNVFKPIVKPDITWNAPPPARSATTNGNDATSAKGNKHSVKMTDHASPTRNHPCSLIHRAADGTPYIRVEAIPKTAEPSRHVGDASLAKPAVKYAKQDWRAITQRNVLSTAGPGQTCSRKSVAKMNAAIWSDPSRPNGDRNAMPIVVNATAEISAVWTKLSVMPATRKSA